ncbi:hypothetical protein B2J88_14870 [Rhodococcus sp. SRB_17]|uniref:nitroreductase/quinone reductase family protein n=1 Tax=Rhodococcus sp. OK302 TaxID=1882769 RepID=UPI000B93E47E|nr:nitroreductase/quinone reductase family protein [Rhodococcus sp. OK302]NMM85636.1 hypothetical protein [Rhodococcus sp. SRB_17]OYD70276.1 uncharacterized protein DUF385 [Rhodococcus sp. OK302]
MNTFQKIAAAVNKIVLATTHIPVLGKYAGKSMLVLTYTGRKSGKTFTLPVSFTQSGNELTIRVALPDKKNWWRNFRNEGAPVTATLNGVDRTGHAVSHRDARGRVTVTVTLDPENRPTH